MFLDLYILQSSQDEKEQKLIPVIGDGAAVLEQKKPSFRDKKPVPLSLEGCDVPMFYKLLGKNKKERDSFLFFEYMNDYNAPH